MLKEVGYYLLIVLVANCPLSQGLIYIFPQSFEISQWKSEGILSINLIIDQFSGFQFSFLQRNVDKNVCDS